MSILLIDPDPELGAAIVDRLRSEGDEVRVLSDRPGDWKDRGAYLASGDPLDADLVERACTNVRTVVFVARERKLGMSLLTSALTAAGRAGTDRVVVCLPGPDATVVRAVESSGMSYVTLITGRRGFLPKKTIEPGSLAEAVSAADDLAGEPRLVVDLTTEEGWRQLGGHA